MKLMKDILKSIQIFSVIILLIPAFTLSQIIKLIIYVVLMLDLASDLLIINILRLSPEKLLDEDYRSITLTYIKNEGLD